jgi:type VI secretion system secreted protein VgrG
VADTPHPFRLSTTLGADALQFLSMSATEELGRLFSFDVLALSTDHDIAPTSLLGTKATVTIELGDGQERHFNGLVCGFAAEGVHARAHYRYRLVLRPWLWLATRRADTRIFQHLSVVDIIKQVFEPFTPDFELKLSASYAPREYCVQYRESDFNFVSRLMEQEGIYYHFNHADGRHTLVLEDAPGAHQPCPVQSEFVFRNAVDRLVDIEPITEWSATRQVHTGKVVLTDYDFAKPATSLLADHASDRPDAVAKLEVYDYPGDYLVQGEGQRYARLRQQEYDADVARVHGAGPVRALATGHRFKLKEHPQPSQNKDYLVVSTQIEARLGGYESGRNELHFHNRFTAIDSKTTWRSRCTTPRPTVSGLHTAKVVGVAGEEIYTDEHGRIKVHFHWDRHGKRDGSDTCWIRVASPWAGPMRGWVSVPRIGDEVIVDFIEGDPDRPLVTGSVYNGTQPPPWALPANKTQTGLLTRSTKGGAGETNANVFRFEDKKGSEQVWLHAEKDQLIEVEHDEDHTVGNDRRKTIDRDETTHVKRDRTETVDRHETITIGVNRTESVGNNESISIGANRSVSIGGNKSETVAGAKAETIALAKALSIGGAYQTSVGAAMNTTVALAQAEQIGLAKMVVVGQSFTTMVGASYQLKVADEIVLQTGNASITMKSSGEITISGTKLQITGSDHIKLTSPEIFDN